MTTTSLSIDDTPSIDDTRRLIASACRILAMEGLVSGTLGHVSARVGDNQMLVRCRGPRERGLLFTEPDDVRLVDFDGHHVEPEEGYQVPNEVPIHGETLRQRPEAGAVVHAHPPAVLACALAGLPLEPIFGAYDIPATRMAAEGIPVYPRSVLIRRAQLAHDMLEAMGDRPVCILKGHGITAIGATVEQAVVAALGLNTLATVTLDVARAGGTPTRIPDTDLAELPDLGASFNAGIAWSCLLAKAERQGL